jgi:hypothetical protein
MKATLILLLTTSTLFAWDGEEESNRLLAETKAKTEALYESRRKSEEITANFTGSMVGGNGATLSRNTAITGDGQYVSFDGRGFATTGKYYGHSRNQNWGNAEYVVRSGSIYYGSSLVWQTQGAFFRLNDAKPSYVVTSPGVSASMRKP